MQVRYQAALRPDEARDSTRGATRRGRTSAQNFENLGQFGAQLQRRYRPALGRTAIGVVLEPLPRAVDGEAFIVEKFSDAPDQQNFMVLVVASVAATLDGPKLGELLLPIAQNVRLDGAQLGNLANGEVSLGGDGREVTPRRTFQFARLPLGT